MRGKRKFAGILLLILSIIIVQLPVSKADAKTSASDFIVQSGKLIKYQGSSSNVTIPDSVDTVGKSAFENNSKVEHVVIPKSVKRIEAYAFWNCTNLTNVSVGSGMMEISDFAFANCHGLTQMVLPDNIKYIGIDAFQDCVNLTDITIPPETIDIHE
nr:leucine-rich repeat domain-containing protein [Acetatifactor sp.]